MPLFPINTMRNALQKMLIKRILEVKYGHILDVVEKESKALVDALSDKDVEDIMNRLLKAPTKPKEGVDIYELVMAKIEQKKG